MAEQRFVVAADAPVIQALTRAGIGDARDAASHAEFERLAARRGSRIVAASEIPYLTGSPEGRRFLEAASPRALARGEPAASCPSVALAAGRAASARPEDVAAAALGACLDRLDEIAPGSGCGCRVVALNDVVTVPRPETAYATGIPARLVSEARGLDLLLVAEETDSGITLRDLGAEVARIEPGPATRLIFSDGSGTFEGNRIPVGFRRGRIAARYYLQNEDGERLTLLLGFDPDELATSAGAWLAWGG